MAKIEYKHHLNNISDAIGVSEHMQEKIDTYLSERFIDARSEYDTVTEVIEEYLNTIKPQSPSDYFMAGVQFASATKAREMAKDKYIEDELKKHGFDKMIDEVLDVEKIKQYVDKFEELI